jgi:hypothetical protein
VRRGGSQPFGDGRHERSDPKQIAGFEEIKASAKTIVGGGEKILRRAPPDGKGDR